MTIPTWQFYGDEHLQAMFRYMRDPIAGRIIADVIGSKDSDYRQWATCAGAPCVHGSRTSTEIYVDEVKPAAVVILLGSNPRIAGVPAEFLAHVREVVRIGRKHGGQVLLVGPFASDPSGARLAALRSVIPDTIDGRALASGLPRASDGIHLTQEGYRTLTERMIGEVFRVWDVRERAGVAPAEPPPSNPIPETVSEAPPAPPVPSPSSPPAPDLPTVTITPVVPETPGAPAVTRVAVEEQKSGTRSRYVKAGLIVAGALALLGVGYVIVRRRRRR